MCPESLRSEHVGHEEEREDGQWIYVPLPEERPPVTVTVPAVFPPGHTESVAGLLYLEGWQTVPGQVTDMLPSASVEALDNGENSLSRTARAVGSSANGTATSFFSHREGVTVVFRPCI